MFLSVATGVFGGDPCASTSWASQREAAHGEAFGPIAETRLAIEKDNVKVKQNRQNTGQQGS